MIGQGGRCQNAQKQNIIKLIRNKPVGKYQFRMAFIRA